VLCQISKWRVDKGGDVVYNGLMDKNKNGNLKKNGKDTILQ
jgi:hypothetical protein